MARLIWDAPGEKFYETGVDHAVLYLPGGGIVPWNGITSIDENVDDAGADPVYFDGQLVRHVRYAIDYQATVNAFTYPEEFEDVQGFRDLDNGMSTTAQPLRQFSMSYRTSVGSDTTTEDANYKIHILYNLTAIARDIKYGTIQGTVAPTVFSWDLSGLPEDLEGYAPSAHFIADSRYLTAVRLEYLTDILYGTDLVDPSFPSIEDLIEIVQTKLAIEIIDNGDGSWTAIGASSRVKQIDPDTIMLIDVDGYEESPGTFVIQSTAQEMP